MLIHVTPYQFILIVELGIRYSSVQTGDVSSLSIFEKRYFRDPRQAFVWQEHNNDEGEDEGDTDLLTLLRLLRLAVPK